jgi:PKD repeat protein
VRYPTRDESGPQSLTLAGDHSFSLGHAYADNGVYTLTVIVSDDAGGADTDTLTVTVNSAKPVASVGGDTNGVQGQKRTVTLGATDASAADEAAGFGYEIDWGDGTALESVAVGAVKARHAFATPGTYAVRVRAIDKDGAKGSYVTRTIVVKKAELQQDPTSSSRLALVVGGTAGADDIRLVRRSDGTVKVFLNGVSAGAFAPTGKVIVNGWDGNDTITSDARLGFAAMLFGDSGNDTVTGGDKGDALVGGSGKDELRGGVGRDLVIGGKSADRLFGGEDEDVLVGGVTLYDAKHSSLWKLMKEWGRKDATYGDRVAHLRGSTAGGLNDSVLLDTTGARDDGAADALMGEGGVDALWLNADAGVLDTRPDRVSGEKTYDVD